MLKNSFCSSPWFHLHINYDGSYKKCRWGTTNSKNNIKQESILQFYNSDDMKLFRQGLLQGEQNSFCSVCYYEESFGKLNGRIRQLNKSGIDVNNFEYTIRSSPHYENFKHSLENDGSANLAPVDLQIMLGNVCNSACIMCDPESSSRLTADYEKLHKINSTLFKKPTVYQSWSQDQEVLDNFINDLANIKNLRYLHFLGGETFYDDAFYKICDKLIELNLASNIIVGTTTNGTIYNDKICKYISTFKEFHLGISIESVTSLNDYIRYPSNVTEIIQNIQKFLILREEYSQLQISLRITPNIFTIYEIDKLFVFMLENKVIAESCNILYDPKHLRIELLPKNLRLVIKEKLADIIDYYSLETNNLVNIRRNDIIDEVIGKTVIDYYNFICSYEEPEDIEESRHNLIKFIKSFETLRNNSIIDYLPEYENFLRSYGF